jgi:hypothetical protein
MIIYDLHNRIELPETEEKSVEDEYAKECEKETLDLEQFLDQHKTQEEKQAYFAKCKKQR